VVFEAEMMVVVLVEESTEILEFVVEVELSARVKTREDVVGDAPEEVGAIVVKTVVVTYLTELALAETVWLSVIESCACAGSYNIASANAQYSAVPRNSLILEVAYVSVLSCSKQLVSGDIQPLQ
jgi:hypothetical protein